MGTPALELPLGSILARKYRVERILGHGGMGVVYGARHIRLDERVAIKVLRPELATSPALVSRFLAEAKAATKIRGEHVVRVLDVDVDPERGMPFIVMEYLDGEDLGAYLQRNGRVDPATAAGWVLQACEALAEAHALGIVHRDLKPANLFRALRPDGRYAVKVLDFGISKFLDRPHDEGPTEEGRAIGTPMYMAPEQLTLVSRVDARADLWALGVILYELVEDDGPFADVQSQLAGRMRAFTAAVPQRFEVAVSKCLAVDVRERFQSVAALADALAPLRIATSIGDAERVAAVLARRADLEETAVVGPPKMTPAAVPSDETPSNAVTPRLDRDRVANATTEDAPTLPRAPRPADTLDTMSSSRDRTPVPNRRHAAVALVLVLVMSSWWVLAHLREAALRGATSAEAAASRESPALVTSVTATAASVEVGVAPVSAAPAAASSPAAPPRVTKLPVPPHPSVAKPIKPKTKSNEDI